ncbi:MAG: AgmX/PglI C-terminal domain-containing protein [Polyangiaceae bacterium]|nr:AgmX/PglI C-terminal domain-containing protein [Polyangiaceae bacterium]
MGKSKKLLRKIQLRMRKMIGGTIALGAINSSVACASPQATPSTQVETASAPEDCVDYAEIQKVLMARDMAYQDCYADGLANNPELKGTVTLSFTIPPTGHVEKVSVASSDLGSSDVETCIAEVASDLDFQQSSCQLAKRIEYPVRLQRGSSEFALN